jgi:hypothetical protein
MEYILNHQEVRKEMSQKAKVNVLEYTAEKSAGKLIKLYEETISRHGSK